MVARIAFALVLAACADHPNDPPVAVETTRAYAFDIRLAVPAQLDVLFVIDSSPAMAAHAARLRANYRTFMHVLGTLDGGLPSVQIAVVTADLGTTGATDAHAGPALGERCRGRGDDARFRTIDAIGDVLVSRQLADGSRSQSFEGPLGDAFAALADVGAAGCELVQPLEAMRRALEAHPGFLREHAYLQIIFLTAQDDCSFPTSRFLDDLRTSPMDTYRCYARGDDLVAVDDYVAFLKALKRDPSMVMIGIASGPPGPVVTVVEWRHRFIAPACSIDGATAAPAPRLHHLASEFPNRSTTVTLCQDDLTGVMAVTSTLARTFVGNPCIPVPLLDVDPAMPGDQLDCAVEYAFREGRVVIDGPAIPRCAGTARPCWHIEADPRACPEGASQRVYVEHGPVELPFDTHVVGQCLAE